MFLSPIDVSLPLSLCPFPSLYKSISMSSGEDKTKKKPPSEEFYSSWMSPEQRKDEGYETRTPRIKSLKSDFRGYAGQLYLFTGFGRGEG